MKNLLLTIFLLFASAAGAEVRSPRWLQRVEPEDIGMDPAVLKEGR